MALPAFLAPLLGGGLSFLKSELLDKPQAEEQERKQKLLQSELLRIGRAPLSGQALSQASQQAAQPSSFNAALSGAGRGLEFLASNPQLFEDEVASGVQESLSAVPSQVASQIAPQAPARFNAALAQPNISAPQPIAETSQIVMGPSGRYMVRK